jgi:hypothetical protein
VDQVILPVTRLPMTEVAVLTIERMVAMHHLKYSSKRPLELAVGLQLTGLEIQHPK